MSTEDPPILSVADASTLKPPPDTQVVKNDGYDNIGEFPVLLWDRYIYWPLSFKNNNNSMAIVQTENGRTVQTVVANGARYIDSIEVDAANEIVRFIGQEGHIASLAFDQLFIVVVFETRSITVTSRTSSLAIPDTTMVRVTTTSGTATLNTTESGSSFDPNAQSDVAGTLGLALGVPLGVASLFALVLYIYRRYFRPRHSSTGGHRGASASSSQSSIAMRNRPRSTPAAAAQPPRTSPPRPPVSESGQSEVYRTISRGPGLYRSDSNLAA
ncbi:hypothetical protein TWF696_004133 [Orbilia brochopaga]|uniref:Transmembrane protein n=1 Tax=Orbilia brochopaga TaxID=3140254 RepID=A0AAV9VBQ7_9PEZI